MASEHRGTLTRREPRELRPFETTGIFSPFALLRDMTDWMDQVFEGGDLPARRGERMWTPAVEVREHDNTLTVCADLPGIDPKDVKVEAENGRLVIQGERRREQNQEQEGVRRSERFYGTYYRAIPLPESAKLDQAKADFRNGVLEIHVPMEQAKSTRRQIPIGGMEKTQGQTQK